jgi:Na+/phosphate symporter
MEIRLVIFLGLTSVTLITNTLLIWFAYKALAGFTSRITGTLTEFEKAGLTKAWISSMETAAEQALNVTEIAKEKMAECDSVLERAQQQYALALANVDSKLEQAGDELSNGARKVRDTVAKPAFTFMSFIAGLSRAVQKWGSEGEET